jgi:hypothetical protein
LFSVAYIRIIEINEINPLQRNWIGINPREVSFERNGTITEEIPRFAN